MAKSPKRARSTLKIVKQRLGPIDSDDEDTDEDDEFLQALIANGGDLDEDDEELDSYEPNGGPSDPSKAQQARQEAAIKKLLEATKDVQDSDEDMDEDDDDEDDVEKLVNGTGPARRASSLPQAKRMRTRTRTRTKRRATTRKASIWRASSSAPSTPSGYVCLL